MSTTTNQPTIIRSLEWSFTTLHAKKEAVLTSLKVESNQEEPDNQLILQYNEQYRELQTAVTDIGQMISHYRSILGQL
jgi:hypothetical protein